MSADAGGYSPLSYHCGSVWTHDTAIVDRRPGPQPGTARPRARLADGLLAAGAAFDWRLPELCGGDARDGRPAPVPYPAACRPQAWSAASAVALHDRAAGLDPDVPRAASTSARQAHYPSAH